ncbi:hypothetical protein S40285_09458 [Stachybotrys chlorohalonatus IBT 40285]|uniref:Uncharacterized protein n=1 Tax=Stachybotrys chlorohalonatus (strain IBT 40285) TaxID=1283841 RepID=A0A084QZV3_STAC4|nr:hypothetical protein S40285_09458 [Stachybotrys chlorohalonata IBT 40285]
MKLLLAKDGINPDSKDNLDRTPLSWAAERGHEEVVKLLLAKDGINPDLKDNSGRTPLLWATKHGHEGVVKLLLAKDGINTDSKDNSGRTPLSWAAERGHEELVKLLLAKDGINPDLKDNSDRTPLSWAAERGHEEVVKLLLAKDGINLDLKDKWSGRTPLSWAAERGHEKIVKLLSSKHGESSGAATPAYQQTFVGHADTINVVAFSPDGKLISSGSDDMTVKLWDAEKQRGDSPHAQDWGPRRRYYQTSVKTTAAPAALTTVQTAKHTSEAKAELTPAAESQTGRKKWKSTLALEAILPWMGRERIAPQMVPKPQAQEAMEAAPMKEEESPTVKRMLQLSIFFLLILSLLLYILFRLTLFLFVFFPFLFNR